MARKTLKSGLSERRKQELKKKDMQFNIILFSILFLYFGIVLGGCALRTENGTLFETVAYFIEHLPESFLYVYPFDALYLVIGVIAALIVDTLLFNSWYLKKDVIDNAHGDAAFEDDWAQYKKEFVYDPSIVAKIMKVDKDKLKGYYNDLDGHKFIVDQRMTKKQMEKVHSACWANTQIYSENVSLSLNGKWTQRNANALIFGASGAGKTRFFLSPNLLQANATYVVTDPSGDIMQKYGAFLKERGYIVKCLNVEYMEQSCRFNPLYYIKDIEDILVIVNSFLENTKMPGKGGGDEFWDQSAKSLLCAIIGYLFEVLPLEQRNFYNVLNLLKMAPQDENATQTVDNEFDQMFKELGKKNPGSYAFQQYKVFKLAPTKTALSTLISTAVKFSSYVDVPKFNNLTYKDEMELEKIGTAPFLDKKGKPMVHVVKDGNGDPMQFPVTDKNGKPIKEGNSTKMEDMTVPYTLDEIMADPELEKRLQRDKDGTPVEGAPYKVALFLQIPQGDTTYNWLIGMLYTVLFDKVYKAGSTRMKSINIGDPELAIPVRFLIDECANIGKIPNLQERLATCRKYRLSVVPIFQNYSQIEKVYGDKDANSIISNCDTTLFLGGSDQATLKIIQAHMGKFTAKTMSTGVSKSKTNSSSTNIQQTGSDLMSNFQIEQMPNSQCLVFIRSVKPIIDNKYPLQNHPNYKFSAEKDRKNYSFYNPFANKYNGEEIEGVRLKSCNEDGYIVPEVVDDARSRAEKKSRCDKRLKELENMSSKLGEVKAKCDSNPADRRSASNYERSKEDFIKLVETLKQDAIVDNDNAFLERLVQINTIFGLGLSDDVKNGSQQNAAPEACDATLTKNEHRQREEARRAGREIINIQKEKGGMLPSANHEDYTPGTPIDPFAEFAHPVFSDKQMELYNTFFKPGVPSVAGIVSALKQNSEDTAREAQEKAEAERKAEEDRKRADELKAAEAREKAEKEKQEREAKLAEQKAKEEAERKAAEEKRLAEAKAAEEARLAEEKRLAAERAEAERIAAEKAAKEARLAEEQRKAEEAKKAEEARLAEEARKAEEARLAAEAKRLEEERLAKEAAEKAEAERLAKEAEEKRRAEAEAALENRRQEKEARKAAAKAKREAERAALLAQLAALEETDEDEEEEEPIVVNPPVVDEAPVVVETPAPITPVEPETEVEEDLDALIGAALDGLQDEPDEKQEETLSTADDKILEEAPVRAPVQNDEKPAADDTSKNKQPSKTPKTEDEAYLGLDFTGFEDEKYEDE